MKVGSVLGRARRSLAFARHIPLGQLLRRFTLMARRRYRDRMGWRAPAADSPASAAPPRPPFPPRTGMIARMPEGLAVMFLGRAFLMPGGVMDWEAPSLAPSDQLWRMNLHYMEYLEAIDDADFVAIIEDWIACNPPGRRGAWKDAWNGYALSLRVVVWMQQLASRGGAIPDASRVAIHASLHQQLTFLEANLETDIGGNHLVKNIKALLWGSAFFDGPASTRWRRTGLDLLRQSLKEQVLADGTHYERSPSYHAQVFADFLECRRALGEEHAPPELDAALRAMAVATADLAHPDGYVAQFNDAGLTMAYPPGRCLDVFQALLGERPEPRASFGFAAAGYFGWRSGGTYFVADCGRIGPDSLPAHAHGDILSFEWSVDGERFIVDPGVYEYIAGERRSASRSAASHNTLCFDGLDQAKFFGAFRCGRRPNVTVRKLEHDARGLVLQGTHDGFGALRHARRFEVDAMGIRVTDRVEAPEGRRAAIGFLLHPTVEVAAEGDGFALTRGATRVKMRSGAKIVVEEAFWSPDMGYERATKRLRVLWDQGSAEIVTIFALSPDSPIEAP
jgi:uncharacterized heparinase superfamily protein